MRLFSLVLLILSPMVSALTLNSPQWQIDIDPSTLAVSAVLPDQQKLMVSTPQLASDVNHLQQSAGEASWSRDGTQVIAKIDANKLSLRFSRNAPGKISWPQTPAHAKALILPLFEGSYIPASDALWRDALLNEYQDIDTTQGLSLPVLGLEYGRRVLSVLYINPYNNQLHFSGDANGLGVAASHKFTQLDYARPYEVQIALDEHDLLAPAKQYRSWLKSQGVFVPLSDKLAAAKEGARLIGASHVYLWGDRMITPRDVRDWRLLQASVPSPWLSSRGAREAQKSAGIVANAYLQKVLIDAIQDGVEKEIPGSEAKDYSLRRQRLIAQLGKALNPPESWGDVNPAIIGELKRAGLDKLWLGLPQWSAAFASPAGVASARKAGYLIGPYDSYDTALPDGNDNPSWLSAQLGQDAFERCGILLENGKRKTGFKGDGVYTNPACVRPLMEQRAPKIQAAAGFNSWFLDVDATGMLFDDYDPSKLTSQAQDAQNRVDGMAWLGKNLGVIIGSEDGHAVANQSVAFAHGMQTRGFGWLDADMRKNKQSPYFLGAWYPQEEPEYFFKSTSIKDQFRALYFNPARRLPLFQAAFHDSVITTHHWTIDNLKFKDVHASTELMQQLYNVPPLLNISQNTVKKRAAYLARLDRFFRPLHERLYNQALIDFRYLTDDGLVQKTQFSDGTVILANFGKTVVTQQDQSLAAGAAVAILPDGKKLHFQSQMGI